MLYLYQDKGKAIATSPHSVIQTRGKIETIHSTYRLEINMNQAANLNKL